jgi:hypothetical protein
MGIFAWDSFYCFLDPWVSPLQGGNGEEHDAGEEDDGAGEVEARVVVSDGVIQST